MAITLPPFKRFSILLGAVLAISLSACSDSGGGDNPIQPVPPPPDPDPTAFQTGATEPLYPFQWALNHKDSYFSAFASAANGTDLNVEDAHRAGVKGQGVRVLVLDSGVDLHNEDLASNADPSMSWNFVNNSHDPYPTILNDHHTAPHGTAVAGIIAAAQNQKGVMGIAPRVSLGGANVLDADDSVNAEDLQARFALAYGGADWSRQADLINGSYGEDEMAKPYDDVDSDNMQDLETPLVRGLKTLRDGRGVVFIKSAGNEYTTNGDQTIVCDGPTASRACVNVANDPLSLEPNVLHIAALTAQGQAATYSSAGSVNWVSGMGGEYGDYGLYGENPDNQHQGRGPLDGPTLFSTDMRGCAAGYSYQGGKVPAATPFLRGETQRNGMADNPACDYSYMNGTSAAAPSISGVAALILSANPELSWRDVRDILRLSARRVDVDYLQRRPDGPEGTLPRFGDQLDLSNNQWVNALSSPTDIAAAATRVPLDLGWQTNAAGLAYSNRYGFGLPDASQAVALAQAYARDPSLGRLADVHIPNFTTTVYWHKNMGDLMETQDLAGVVPAELPGGFPYRQVSLLGTFKVAQGNAIVDEFQLRLSGQGVCLGAIGLAVKSPSGTMSLLKLPNDHFSGGAESIDDGTRIPVDEFLQYGLGSYAFYNEAAAGDWSLYMLAANPDTASAIKTFIDCPSVLDDAPRDFAFIVESRVITQ
ncbi:S8 family peptidase [Castellaniella sp.]|uniref:S8 family peptidase n=1 Tax=Castellaniella sp. TaxID=1955812 RepID=UPI002AFEAABF|nr:S8 family serine peptidase [Castellaniella sp.]